MKFFALGLAGLALAAGAGGQPNPEPNAASKERAAKLGKQLRAAMSELSILKLEAGRSADSGLRGLRQREAGKPLMHQLVDCGADAEGPLWLLITDADASVRASTVILLGSARIDATGKPVPTQTLLALHIPLLERALSAKDAQVRFFACDALGNFADWSADCQESLRGSVPKLRELRNDSDASVRAIAWTACNGILGKLAANAKKPEDRLAAAEEQKQLQREKKW